MTDHTTMQGQVLAVEHEPQGGVALSWTGTELSVQNAADFNREGGQFVVEGDPRVFTYTGVTEAPGDEDENAPDTVHTDEPAPVTITEETAVYIWPEALEVTAQVATDDTPDGVQATVPHNLRAQLVPGVREPAAREWVRLELHGHEWLVADVVGRRAVVQADAVEGLNDRLAELQENLGISQEQLDAAKAELEAAAKVREQALADAQDQLRLSQEQLVQVQQDLNAADLGLSRAIDAAQRDAAAADAKATAAQTSADGKNNITDSPNAPTRSTPGKSVGDTWRQVSGGVIAGVWNWTALGWVPRPISSAAIDNLDVGKLTAGTASISQVVAQKLAADFGAFRVLTADKLVIGNTTNLLPNGALEWGDARYWHPTLAAGYQTTDVPPSLSAAITTAPAQGTIQAFATPAPIPVSPGQEFLVEVWLKADKPGSRIYLELRNQASLWPGGYYDLDTGAPLGSSHMLSAVEVPTTWTRFRRRLLIDPNGSTTQIKPAAIYFNHSSGTEKGAAVSIAGWRVVMRNSGELIVDGSITAPKLVANAVTTDKLAANAVTASKVRADEAYARVIGGLLADFQQVFADKITADMVVADQVLAGKVAALMASFQEVFTGKLVADMLNVDQALAQKLQAVIATFQEVFAGTIVADMIDLDTLNGKVLNGVDIYSPHQTATPRVHVGGATIETVRSYTQEDGATNEVVGISLGGPTADKMQLLNPDGSVLAGFDTDGSGRSSDFAAQGDITATGKVTADAGDFGTLSIGPYPDLADELSNRPRGVIARQKFGSSAVGNGVKFGSSYLGYYELFFAPGDQLTKVTYAGQIYADGPGYYAVRLVATSDPDPDVIPASPDIPRGSFAPVAFCGFQASAKGLYPIYLEGWVQPYSGSYRVLLMAAVPSGGPSGYVWSTDSEPSWMVAESVGGYTGFADGGYNRGGGTPYTGSATVVEKAPAAVKRTYTSTWNATGVATYREGVGSMSTSQYKLQQGTYGGKNRWSHVVFNGGAVSGEKGRTIAQALSGATVSKVEFYGLVKDTHNNAGGTAVLSPAIPTELTSISTSTAESRFSGWKAGTAKWVTLSNALGNRTRSVAIGPDSSGLTEYIKFDPTRANLKLRITYTR